MKVKLLSEQYNFISQMIHRGTALRDWSNWTQSWSSQGVVTSRQLKQRLFKEMPEIKDELNKLDKNKKEISELRAKERKLRQDIIKRIDRSRDKARRGV